MKLKNSYSQTCPKIAKTCVAWQTFQSSPGKTVWARYLKFYGVLSSALNEVITKERVFWMQSFETTKISILFDVTRHMVLSIFRRMVITFKLFEIQSWFFDMFLTIKSSIMHNLHCKQVLLVWDASWWWKNDNILKF